MTNKILRFLQDEDGPTTVEYAVMLSLILGLALAGIAVLGEATAASFTDSSDKINQAFNGP